MNGIFVANSYTGELFPVDGYVVKRTLNYHKQGINDVPLWTNRLQTIYDLLMAGF